VTAALTRSRIVELAALAAMLILLAVKYEQYQRHC
jgi:hypothetical protein